MVYFKSIKKTLHYTIHHERYFPWSKVVETIMTTKNIRKKGNRLEIETPNCYILCDLEGDILWVINAKYRK